MAAFRGLDFSIEPGEIRLDGLVLEREREYIYNLLEGIQI